MKLTIAKKLMGGFLIMAVLVLIAGLAGITMVKKVGRSGEQVVMEHAPLEKVSIKAVTSLKQQNNDCRAYLLARGEELVKEAAKINKSLGACPRTMVFLAA